MKILMVLEFFVPHYNGGGEHRGYEIAKRLVERGHEVDVLTMNITDKKFEKIDGINVHHIGPNIKEIPYRSLFDFIRYFFSVATWLLTHNYDIIDTQCYSPLLSTSIFSRITRTPLIGTIHDTSTNNNDQWIQTSKLASFMEKVLVRLKFDKIITVSHATKNSLINDFGVNGDIITILYNGVDIKKYDKIKQDKVNKNQIIFIGRLVPHKHVDHFIQIINEIKSQFDNIHFVIVGKGSEQENLINKVNKLELTNHITFKQGLTDDELIKEIKESEFLVLPSTREGFGMVLAEANCCKKPVITYASGGTIEVIEDGINGFLIEPQNIQEFKEKTIQLLENKKLQKQLGHNGRQKVEKYFDWEKIADDYLKILKNTTNNKNKPI